MTRPLRCALAWALSGAVLALLLGACDALVPGVRLLRVDYSVGGEVVLSTYYEDPDARRADDVWDYLAETPVFTGDDSAPLPPDENDPLRATLRDGVRIEVKHVDLSLRRAEIAEITLVRPTADAPRWHLSAEDVEATRPR